jgi:hypothetical protein
MIIRDLKTERDGDTTQVSAEVDGFRVWFRAPGLYALSSAADPFFAAALLPAMTTGGSLEVDPGLALSPTLLRNAQELQEIFHCWNPRQLKLVPMKATARPAQQLNSGSLAFFSGGVDSTYTFLKRADEITHVVFIHGFDFSHDERADFEVALKRNSLFAEKFGKTLIPIETNLYQYLYRYHLSRNLSQGAHLGAVAMLLGFPVVFIPSSDSYNDLSPLGSHPLTDPLWSNECVRIIHDGCEARRVEKLKRICQSEEALSNLQVCFGSVKANCGKCSKCVRTMIPLSLLGVSTEAFPPLPSLKSLRRSVRSQTGEFAMQFTRENAELAALIDDRSNDALRKMLDGLVRRAELRQAVRLIDHALLGGIMRQASRRVGRVGKPKIFYVDTTPPED